MRSLAVLALVLVVPSALACGVRDSLSNAAAPEPQISDSAGVRVVTNAALGDSASGFRLSATPRASIGVVEGAPEYTLSGAWGTVLSDGTILLLDGGSSQLRFYDASGKFLRSAGREGDGPGELRRSTQLAGLLPGDSIVLQDIFGPRKISVFTPTGDYARSIVVPEEVGFQLTVESVLPDGRVLIRSAPLLRVNRPGVVRDTVSEWWVSLRDGSASHWADFPGNEVYKLGTGLNSAPLVFGRGLDANARGERVVVGNNDAYSIRVYDVTGKLLQIVREDGPPVKVDPGEWEETIPPPRPGADPNSRFAIGFRDQPHLDTKPPWGGFCFLSCLQLDQVGNLWVREYSAGFAGHVPSGTWHIFDPSGVLLGRITLPPRAVFMDAGRDWVLVRQLDDLDVQHVVLYGLERTTGK